MTAELGLLIFIYAAFIIRIFLGGFAQNDTGAKGLVHVFQDTVPALSARIEKHTTTGYGFWNGKNKRDPERGWDPP